jgi:hypothetical protein
VQRFCLAMVVACSAVWFAVAGPARADAGDQQYLEQLKANDLSCGQTAFECPQGDDSMIAVAHAICRQLHGGNSARSLATQLIRSMPTLQPDQAAKVVQAAETAYCPR